LLIENSNLDKETTHFANTSPVPAFMERNFYKENLVDVELILFSD